MVRYLDSLNDCFGKGLLKRINKQHDLALKDIKIAEFFLKEAEDQLEMNKEVMDALALYNAYFHAVRALLFNDGVKERSHFCIARYLEEEYVLKSRINVKFLNAYETIMSLRHNAQYSTEQIEIEEDLDELFNVCEDFLTVIRKVIE